MAKQKLGLVANRSFTATKANTSFKVVAAAARNIVHSFTQISIISKCSSQFYFQLFMISKSSPFKLYLIF